MKLNTLSYKKTFKNWCLNSTMDGLPNIARAKGHLLYFIFWIVFFLASSAVCIYMITKLIIDYYKFDVITTDRIVPYNEINFPMVTICNENMFLSPQANKFIRDYFLANFNTSVNSYNDIVNRFGSVDQAEKEINWMIYQLQVGEWNKTVLKSLGYSAEDTFFYLEFGRFNLSDSDDLEWYFDKKYGNCYRFNANQTFNALRLGYGLYIEIFTGLPYNYHKPILDGQSKGLVIEIKDPNIFTNLQNVMRIPPGQYTKIKLLKTKSSTLAKPYSDCNSQLGLFSSPAFDEMMRLGFDYDQSICIDAINQYKIVKSLNCSSVTYAPLFDYYPTCKNRSVIDYLAKTNLPVNEIRAMCPIDCFRQAYEFSISAESFPSEPWIKTNVFFYKDYFVSLFGNKTPDFASAKESLAAITISYDRIAIEEISENPFIEIAGLLSNIGSNLGLFIGPSFLTLTEIFELVFMFTAIWWTQKKLAKVKNVELKNQIEEVFTPEQPVQLIKIT